MSAAVSKPKGKNRFSGLVTGCAVVGAFLTVIFGLGAIERMTPDTPAQKAVQVTERFSGSSQKTSQPESSGSPRPTAAVSECSSPETGVRHELTARPLKEEWSSWVCIPSGRTFISCEANADLSCADTESDVTKVTYAYQCKNLRGEVVDWTPAACEHYIAIRVRSKDDAARSLAYWLEPYKG